MAIVETFCGIIILFCAIYYYYIWKFNFWKERGIPGPKAVPYFGTMKDVVLGKTTLMEHYKNLYDAYKSEPLIGIFRYSKPMLIVNDPGLIKDILITDAAVFTGRGIPFSEKAEPIMNNIIYMKGETPLHLRAKISPIFTPSKLKSMFSLLLQRTGVFKEWLDMLLLQDDQINFSELMQKFMIDYACICMFGYDMKMSGDRENEIIQCAKRSTRDDWQNNMKRKLIDTTKQLYDLIGYYLFDNAKMMEVFSHFAKDVAKYRKEHGIVNFDIANVLMGLKQNPGKLAEKIEITDEFIIAQYYIFFVTAYETSAATVSNTLYELALNHSIQDRLREEIRNTYEKGKGEITFDDINTNMPYLDSVVKETLRKYPVVDALPRETASPYTFRNTKITIPKDIVVLIPAYGIHCDPEIYPKPEVYDPERFLNGELSHKQSMCYIPFGYGPRNCIGKRFGVLQISIALITILRDYKVDICEKTKIPYEYSNEIIVQQSKGIYLKVTKIH